MTYSHVKRRTCGRRKRLRYFVTRSRNSLADTRRHWGDWTHSYSQGASGRTPPTIRARICDGLGFLGIELDQERNAKHEPWISSGTGRVKVRVIRTDEELMIAKSVMQILHLDSNQETKI